MLFHKNRAQRFGYDPKALFAMQTRRRIMFGWLQTLFFEKTFKYGYLPYAFASRSEARYFEVKATSLAEADKKADEYFEKEIFGKGLTRMINYFYVEK